MKTKPTISILVVAVVALVHSATPIAQTSRGNQATNPAYLSQFPSVERVKAEMKGTDAMDTAARQMGAFWQLQQIMKDLSGLRWNRNQLTPDEKRLLGQYAFGYQTAAQPYAPIQNAPSHPDKPKWYKLHTFYEVDDGFREELFNRLLSSNLRQEYGRIKGETRATLDARREAREKAWKEEQARAQAASTGGAQPYKREEQAAQALLDGLVKATTELVGALNSQVQTAPSTAAQPSAGKSPAANATVKMTRAEADAYDAYFRQGNTYLDAKQYEKAIEAYKKLPAVSYAHNGLGLAYRGLNRYPEAVAELKEAVRLDPDDPTACKNLGITYVSLNEYSKAVTALQQLIRLKPSDENAHLFLGIAYKALNEYDKAVAAYREAVRLTPNDSSAWAGLGFCYYYLKRDSDAVSALQQAIRLDPKNAYAYRGLGFAYVGLGKREEALQVYKTLQGIDKSEADKVYKSISKMSGAGPKSNAPPATNAASQPTSSTKTTPPDPSAGTSAEAYKAQGDKYREGKNHVKAIEAYKKAIELKPSMSDAHAGLGLAYSELSQFENAIAAFREAIRLNPMTRTTTMDWVTLILIRGGIRMPWGRTSRSFA